MGTSVYFNNQEARVEQQLLEDLIIESIKNHGIDVYYLPRRSQSVNDSLFGDDPVKTYTDAYPIEMFLESARDYECNKEFFSKFGLEIQETAKLVVSRRSYEKYVYSQNSDRRRPKEGDLIFLRHQHKIMEIKFVEEEKNFFQLGRDKVNPYMYGLTVEAFKYNGELFTTGISLIDKIPETQAINLNHAVQAGGTGMYTEFEWVYQGTSLATATAKGVVSNWNEPNLTLKLRNIMGSFAANTVIIGNSSNAHWTLAESADVLQNVNSNENVEDNRGIENEALNILDWAEHNPFGEP
jgi:hypothetical protein